jgi:hypothetical protein
VRNSHRRKSYSPRRKPATGFFIAAMPACKFGFDLPQLMRRFFVKFDSSGKSAAH